MDKIIFNRLKKDIVYIFYAEKGESRFPFYVGETSRGIGRFGDYLSAKFSASTDFKVGEFSKMLVCLGYEIIIEYEASENRKAKEKELISLYKSPMLINGLFGYDYKKCSRKNVLAKMRKHIDNSLSPT